MSRRHLAMLLLLAAIWGSSFMFIKVAVRELSPADVAFFRVALGALALVPALAFVGVARVRADLRRYARHLVVLGVANAAVPFWLLSWSETRLDSGLAAVLQASTPLFAALLALLFSRDDRVVGGRLVGVCVGFVGVALLVGVQPQGDVLAAIAVLATAARPTSASTSRTRSSESRKFAARSRWAPTTPSSVLPHVMPRTVTSGTPVHALASSAPRATPGQTEGPQMTSAARAIPVGGQTAVTLLVVNARSRPSFAEP